MPDLSPPELPPAPPVTATSLASRLTNVFVVPGEVFDEVKAGPAQTTNWLVPVLFSCLAAVVFSLVVFSQDRILYAIREAQQKQIQKMVDSGKLPKDKADAAVSAIERFVTPTLLKISGAAGGIAASFGQLFLAALVVWLIGAKVFKAQFGYMQAVE
ncbi:MAG: YckD family protein, partial [Verrucomicrobia bacterium]|nr:YckD family protein [Verrucomicrobiota bacterium]